MVSSTENVVVPLAVGRCQQWSIILVFDEYLWFLLLENGLNGLSSWQ
jgi:hypothetical protein